MKPCRCVGELRRVWQSLLTVDSTMFEIAAGKIWEHLRFRDQADLKNMRSAILGPQGCIYTAAARHLELLPFGKSAWDDFTALIPCFSELRNLTLPLLCSDAKSTVRFVSAARSLSNLEDFFLRTDSPAPFPGASSPELCSMAELASLAFGNWGRDASSHQLEDIWFPQRVGRLAAGDLAVFGYWLWSASSVFRVVGNAQFGEVACRCHGFLEPTKSRL